MRAEGAFVKVINDEGTFDLLCWYNGRTLLLEIKDGSKPPSARRLTPAEQKFHDEWPLSNLFIIIDPEHAVVQGRLPQHISPTDAEKLALQQGIARL
jgi:hypothetical protein